jgi:hypothetical protein
MKRLHILVEGQTEETFVREVLAPHLQRFGLYPTVSILQTKRLLSGHKYKGGVSSYAKIRRDLLPLLRDTSLVAVTTLLDFYGLPADFPGQADTSKLSDCYEKVAYCEQSFADDINHPRFIPYLMLHEFEAMLFTAPGQIAAEFPETHCLPQLESIKEQFPTPEEINDGHETAPSKRLRGIFGDAYQKTLHGPLIILGIGLQQIWDECPHFAVWITKLEALADG